MLPGMLLLYWQNNNPGLHGTYFGSSSPSIKLNLLVKVQLQRQEAILS